MSNKTVKESSLVLTAHTEPNIAKERGPTGDQRSKKKKEKKEKRRIKITQVESLWYARKTSILTEETKAEYNPMQMHQGGIDRDGANLEHTVTWTRTKMSYDSNTRVKR